MSLIKALQRKQKSLRIASKALLAEAVGVSVPTIYNLFNGKGRPNSRTVTAYAKFLGLSADKVASLAGRGSDRPARQRAASRPAARRRAAKH